MGYRCICCGSNKNNGDKVYFVNNIETLILEPTCSVECAKSILNHNMATLERRLQSLAETELLEEIWDYD